MMIVSALGLGLLGDSFQVAYQLPTMIYILTVGGGLNSVFVPQLVRAMKDDEDGGEAYANRLLTLVMVALAALTALAMYGAPILVSALSTKVAGDPAANDVAVTFTRYFLPSIFFMGVHVVMGQILNARGKFGAMMWTPVLNNIVIIVTLGMFLWVYGTAEHSGMEVTNIPPEGQRLLGIGVLLGLVVQALAMIPYLRETGFRLRLRFDWRGHGLGKAAVLAKWTILFVLANQAGALVVTQLSTSAGIDSGVDGTGFAAYANAQLIWGLPQAIITVSLMAALLPRLSRSAAEGDGGAVRDDISQGLRTTAVAIVPISFGFLALGIPMCTLMFGSSGTSEATNMGFMLMAFGLGLIPYSVQYVVLRAFYAYEDTLLQHGDRGGRQRCRLRRLLLRHPGPLGRGRHGRLVRPGLRDRCRRRLEPAAQEAGRRSGRHSGDADVRETLHRLGARGAAERCGLLRDRPGPRAGRPRLLRRPAGRRSRAARDLLRRRPPDADRRAELTGRHGSRAPGSLKLGYAHNHRPPPCVVHSGGLWAQLVRRRTARTQSYGAQ
jgi:murein biosynthesis integral membrane protein MurJ